MKSKYMFFQIKPKLCSGGYVYSLLAVMLFFLGSHISFAAEMVDKENIWSISLFAATKTADTTTETILFNADFPENQNFVSLAVARKFDSFQKFDFEFEGQFVKHQGVEKYKEYTAAIFIRLVDLSWDNVIDMSFALGEGLSYTTVIPQFEAANHERATRLLNFLAFETTFAHPENKNWEVVIRIHHRSGVFGLFNGVRGASNAWALGLRYKF